MEHGRRTNMVKTLLVVIFLSAINGLPSRAQGLANFSQTGTVDAHSANWIPPTSTFAAPPSSPATGSVYVFTDAASLGTCSGTGSSLSTCRWSGSAWAAISGGTGTGTVTSVATTGPITGGTFTTTGTIACATCGVTGTGLNQFASTTSAQLAGVISDETGTGSAVFAASPTFTGTILAAAGTFSGVVTSLADLTTGTSKTFSAGSGYFECTGTCTITMPVPVAGKQYCVRNANNVSTVITFAAIGSSSMYENTASTAYGTSGTGTFVSGGAVGDKVCFVGKDSTHYDVFSFNGTWTAN